MERENANIERMVQIEVDYSDSGYPERARRLKPHVFRDGEEFCCLYGPDPQVGIFGIGDTALEAIEDWEKDLEERIMHITEGDTHAQEASDSLYREDQ